jgi:hypothetical protein
MRKTQCLKQFFISVRMYINNSYVNKGYDNFMVVFSSLSLFLCRVLWVRYCRVHPLIRKYSLGPDDT